MLLHKYQRPVIVIVVLLTACCVAALGAQAGAGSVGFKSLTFTLSIPGRSFLLFEPVPLTITLENRTAQPVAAHAALNFSARAIEVLIQPEGLPAYRVEDLSSVTIRGQIRPLMLPPGYRRSSMEPLIVGLSKVLPTPGK